MSEKQKKKKYLYINGKAVPVSEQVFRTSRHHGRKEEYFIYDLKTEKFSCDQETQTVRFTPSWEDSYERLLAANHQFAAAGPSPEEEAISNLWLEDLMRGLSPEEQDIITVDVVLVFSLDRLCRKIGDAIRYWHYLNKHGVRLCSVSDGEIDLSMDADIMEVLSI